MDKRGGWNPPLQSAGWCGQNAPVPTSLYSYFFWGGGGLMWKLYTSHFNDWKLRKFAQSANGTFFFLNLWLREVHRGTRTLKADS